MEKHLSRFIRKTLMPDEKVLGDARFHAFYVFSAFLNLSVCLLLGGALQYALDRYVPQHGMGVWPLLSMTGIGLWILAAMMLKRWTTEIILTNRRLLYKRGFFQVTLAEADVEQLASDNVHQSLLGRLLAMAHCMCAASRRTILSCRQSRIRMIFATRSNMRNRPTAKDICMRRTASAATITVNPCFS